MPRYLVGDLQSLRYTGTQYAVTVQDRLVGLLRADIPQTYLLSEHEPKWSQLPLQGVEPEAQGL